MGFDMDFYRGRNVLVTGCTGFKGAWLCRMLADHNANVTGYALEPDTEPSLFEIAHINEDIRLVIGDVRDLENLMATFERVKPEIVIHLAAQPLVRESYRRPVYTYETNIMGTVNILECVRRSKSVRSFLNVTTDKVYKNREWAWGYRENEELNGYDPYSNSKSCSELVTDSYKNSFFMDKGGKSIIPISKVRAGNVIGGGDFAKDRIIPDCVRSVMEGKDILVRNPHSIRPYQHVLEPLYVYLMIAARQLEDDKYSGTYNVGPDESDCIETGALVDLFIKYWGQGSGWKNGSDGGPHETNYLKLDCSKLKATFNWKPRWSLEHAVQKVVEWNKCWIAGENVRACMDSQIREFLQEGSGRNEELEK